MRKWYETPDDNTSHWAFTHRVRPWMTTPSFFETRAGIAIRSETCLPPRFAPSAREVRASSAAPLGRKLLRRHFRERKRVGQTLHATLFARTRA
jgi:hypothetical protein